MKEDLTEIVCIIDRSTSIRTSGLVDSTIEGFNQFLANQKELPGEAKLTLVLFDGEPQRPESAYEVRYDGLPLDQIENLNHRNYVAKGMTALFDAIGRTIDVVRTRQDNTPEDEKPSKTIVMIMTDGEENSSVEYKKDTIQKMIKTMETDLHWSFLFFGAGIDAMKDGGNLNVSVDNTLSYDNTILGTQSAYFTMNSVATRARGMSNTEYLSSKKSLLSDTLNENNT